MHPIQLKALTLHQKNRKKIADYFKIVCFCFCLFTTSCGYRTGPEGFSACYSTISVPYVEGDLNGSFTAATIKAIIDDGVFEYRQYGGALVLNIKQIEINETNIGFRYDRKKGGKLTRDIIPTEERITMRVQVCVVDSASGCTIQGPVYLSASIDYDHDYYFSRNGVNIFSLGQLSDLEEAYDAVQKPLNEAMALKIADYISQGW